MGMNSDGLPVIAASELKVGMYVILPLAWHQHPFLKSHFLIESEKEIQKIRELGIDGIKIDPARSCHDLPTLAEETPKAPESVRQEQAQKAATDNLIATIHDVSLSPEKKSSLVRQHSIIMMQGLLENPTAQNMKEAQKGISEVVRLILTDDDTLQYLLDITSHDFYTYTHSVSVGILGISLAKSLFKNTTNHDMGALGIGFFLHDIGKVGINPALITKPGRLTVEEMNEMQRHPYIGYKLLNETGQLTEEAKIIVLQHHERFDGTGYLKGLRGRDIHIYGRICSIADVFDAMTSDRPYRRKMKPFEALKLMNEEMIHHFQADLLRQFILMFKAHA